MNKIKISELPIVTNINNDDKMIVVQDGVTKSISINKIAKAGQQGTPGANGREIELNKSATNIQ